MNNYKSNKFTPEDSNYLLKLYIGNDYDNVINNNSNLLLIFFGPLVMVYNNMIIQSLFVLYIQTIIMLFLPIGYYALIYFITNIIIFVAYNKMYLADAKYHVNLLCKKYHEKSVIVNHIEKRKKIKYISLIIYTVLLVFVINYAQVINKQFYFYANKGQIGNLTFNYPRDFIMNNNKIYSLDKQCSLEFNYNLLYDRESILRYFSLSKIKPDTMVINNNEWEIYNTPSKSLYLFANYNEIYYVMLNNNEISSSCEETGNNILKTFTVEGSDING